jgi:hypothetical protein
MRFGGELLWIQQWPSINCEKCHDYVNSVPWIQL